MYRFQEKVIFYRIGATEELPSTIETCMVASLLFNCHWRRNYNLKGSTPETQKHKRNKKINNTLLSYNNYDFISKRISNRLMEKNDLLKNVLAAVT